MSYVNLGDFSVDQTVYVYFDSFDANGASASITGLAVTDIEIYKNDSMTQRSSDNGYTLIDTDGIDIDTITGINGFKIDLSDNTDAGFYAAGNDYTIVVSSVTLGGQTVSFIAGIFSIENRHQGPTAAEINSEVLDVLNVDTFSEPGQANPPATPTFREMLHYLYKWTRNKKDSDGTIVQYYNDAGTTVDQKQSVSDSGGTVTKAEIETGP
jgi:hypothetical protein